MKAASAPSTATATASESRFKRATRKTLNLRVSRANAGSLTGPQSPTAKRQTISLLVPRAALRTKSSSTAPCLWSALQPVANFWLARIRRLHQPALAPDHEGDTPWPQS